MLQPVRISLDAMGGDAGPAVVVPGAALALERHPGLRFLMVGNESVLRPLVAQHPALAAAVEIRHAELTVAMDEKPSQALRTGRWKSSMWMAIQAVRDGEADAAVSAGNTGALMAISKVILRMTKDVDRPAIVASWPTMRGVTAVLDVGANVTSDAEQLVEFAIMGAAFHHAVHGSTRPTVGLLNVGTEDVKGHEDVREAHRLLSEIGLDLDYRGFVEGSDIAKGTVDVVVTDGFTGNIALKTAEGMARFFSTTLKETLTSTPMAKAGALIARTQLMKMRARLDPSSVNGGPLLGLNGIVVKSHGGADAAGFANAIKVAADMALSDYSSEIAGNLHTLTDALAAPEPAAAS